MNQSKVHGAIITVLQPGLMTTIQDLGRFGFQRYGVITSGAMDSFAFRMGNLLVGNPEGAAAFEMTLTGAKLQFAQESLIAVTGQGMEPRINEESVPCWSPTYVPAGTTIDFLPQSQGCRTYLAVAGGVAVPEVMGSASTYIRAGIGGFFGRSLKKGDMIDSSAPSAQGMRMLVLLKQRLSSHAFVRANWFVSPELMPRYSKNPTIRVLAGNQLDQFSTESRKHFFDDSFLITPQSDRMGYRLNGPNLQLTEPLELLSEAVSMGTVQVPPNGNPIVLMADHQTTGGYPKIAQVATVDLPVLAQIKPGESVRFEEITLDQAQDLLRDQAMQFAKLKLAMTMAE